jgi:hypothetical protein
MPMLRCPMPSVDITRVPQPTLDEDGWGSVIKLEVGFLRMLIIQTPSSVSLADLVKVKGLHCLRRNMSLRIQTMFRSCEPLKKAWSGWAAVIDEQLKAG